MWVEGDEILRRVDDKSVDKLARIGKWEARMGGNGKWGNRRRWLWWGERNAGCGTMMIWCGLRGR